MGALLTSTGRLYVGGGRFQISAAGGDETAPTLSSATGAATGTTTADGSVSTDEGNGTLYWVVTTSATSPSVAQVQAGQDHTGSAAADSGSQAVSATGTQNVSASGLSASTTYHFHFQQEDAAANDSSVVSSSSFQTDAAAGLDQTATFGAETRSGAGGYQLVDGNGDALTGVSDDGTGTASGYGLSAGGIITPSSDGSLSGEDANTIDFSSDQGSGTATFSIEADRADVRTAAEFGAAVALYDDTSTAKKIAIRPKVEIGPWSQSWFDNSTNTGVITVTSSDTSAPGQWGGFDFGNGTDIRLQDFGNLVFDRINWTVGYNRETAKAGNKGPRLMTQRGPITWKRCKIAGTPWTDIAPGEHRYGLIATETGLTQSDDITFENNLITDASQALRFNFASSGSSGELIIRNNTFENMSIDTVFLGGVPANVTIEGNIVGKYFTDTNRPELTGGGNLSNASLSGAADDTQCLFFAALDYKDFIGSDATLFALAGLTVKRLASGVIEVKALDTGAATAITLTSTSTAESGRRAAILASLDTNATSRLWLWLEDDSLSGAWTEEATTTASGETLDLTSDCTIGGGSLDVAIERVAFWQGVAPDISAEATRDDFLRRTVEAGAEPTYWPGSAVEASVSTAAHGTPIVDIYGHVFDVRDGVNNGSGGAFTRSGVVEIPHGDAFQFLPGADIANITINGNVIVSGRFDGYEDTRHDYHAYQGIFMEDVAPNNYSNVTITNNLVATVSTHAVSLYNPINSRISGNTGVYIPAWKTADFLFPDIAIRQDGAGTASGNTVQGNVANAVTSFEGTDTVTDNIEADHQTTGTNAWSNLFDGDGGGGFVPTSVEDFAVVFANKTGGPLETATPDIGAVHPGNDFDLQTVWYQRSPTFTDLYA